MDRKFMFWLFFLLSLGIFNLITNWAQNNKIGDMETRIEKLEECS